MNIFLILLGKLLSIISRFLNVGSGSTWPGHIALNINKNFIKDILKNSKVKIILIAGTNGKTTTAKLIKEILEKDGKKIIQNQAGANLLNGIASSLLLRSSILCKVNYNFAIFEVDENTLPLILKECNPDFLIFLNLFRDQLDRYGEVNTVAKKWENALKKINKNTTLILNADDPQIAFLGLPRGGVSIPPLRWKDNALFFGLKNRNTNTSIHQHASDSTYCPNCREKLTYNSIYFSHLGDWECKECGYKRPTKVFTKSPFYPLVGAYNEYNANAAVLLTTQIGIDKRTISSALQNFKPAFGRQEILHADEKKIQIFLSKNPTGFNESLKAIADLNAKNLLIILNDRIPDGRDVSWIWDVDFEDFIYSFKSIVISGERIYDMALRVKYAQHFVSDFLFLTEANLKKAISVSLENTPKNETLYILPTYSAMLEVRKILTGKKML